MVNRWLEACSGARLWFDHVSHHTSRLWTTRLYSKSCCGCHIVRRMYKVFCAEHGGWASIKNAWVELLTAFHDPRHSSTAPLTLYLCRRLCIELRCQLTVLFFFFLLISLNFFAHALIILFQLPMLLLVEDDLLNKQIAIVFLAWILDLEVLLLLLKSTVFFVKFLRHVSHQL